MTTLKQFLKPDWRRIVIFVILILILPIFFINACADIVCLVPIPLSFVLGRAVLVLIRSGERTIITPEMIIYLIIPIIINYILSCFIIWIYDKVKKK
jgi:hypothetical protein